MNPLRNELKILDRENNDLAADIECRENYVAVQNMVRYLSSSSLSLFQIQVIRKDLIGMALEADKEGLALQDKLGVAPKEFCDDIIQNGESSARSEHLLNAAVNTIQFAAIWLFIKYFLSSPYTIAWSDLLFVFLYYMGCNFLASYIRNRLSIASNPVVRYLPYLFVFFVFLSAFMLLGRFYEPVNRPIMIADGRLVITVSATIAAAATMLSNIYWQRCARKYTC